jgi:tRNA-specific adenosine deaminase 1
MTYLEAKHSLVDYQAAKNALRGEGAPFAGWLHTGSSWDEFTLDGPNQATCSKVKPIDE